MNHRKKTAKKSVHLFESYDATHTDRQTDKDVKL